MTIDTFLAETGTGRIEIKPRAVVAIRARGSVVRIDVHDARVAVRRIVARTVDATTSRVLYLSLAKLVQGERNTK